MFKFIIGSALFLCFATSFTQPVKIAEVRTQLIGTERPHLVLYYAPYCPYCQKVLNYLQSIGKTVPMKSTQEEGARRELKKIGGKNQVPCLMINGTPLYESNDIIQWLGKHHYWLENS